MNYIFLDVDGVLNSENFIKEHLDDDVILDESKVELLEKLVKATNAKVVLSSSWRTFFSPKMNVLTSIWTFEPYTRGKELKALLEKHGIKLVGRTKVSRNRWGDIYDEGLRGDEIEKYIKNHLNENDKFVVFDDEIFALESSLMRFGDSFIRTEWKEGLQEKDIEKALNILEKIV